MIQEGKVYKLIQVQRFKQKQISNVMKNKNHNRNKNIKSGPKSNPHQKSKQKSKDKTKKFNPFQYLNALIQLTSNTNVLKPKTKKSTQKRDLSSALTTATPAMSQTISSSKIRCKSSYSQYRKKHTTTNNLKQILNLNLNHYIITEQEDSTNCIKFTSISSATNSKQQTPLGQNALLVFKKNHFSPQSLQLRSSSRIIDYNYYATKIQRAWRSYQTYQMVRRYYKHFKKEIKYNHQRQQYQKHLHYVPLTYRDQEHYQPIQRLTSFETPLNESQQKMQEQCLQKTIKFKIKTKQISQNQNQQKVQTYNSQSSNELNLTQKLSQIKLFVQKQKLRQMKDKIQIKQSQSQKCRKSNDSQTQKKNNFSKMKNFQRQSQGLINYKSQQECSFESQNPKKSLVDSMIKKQTQKYNEILKLIEGCNITQKQTNNKTGSILSELLNRLEKHKEQLITSKQNLVKKVAPKPESPKSLISIGLKKSSKSFLAVDSNDVDRQFEEYEFNTEQKDVTNKQIIISNNKSKQKKVKRQEKKQKQESQKKIESLRKYCNLLSNESEKLQNLIHKSNETDNFCLQSIVTLSNESSKLQIQSISRSQQSRKQSSSKNLLLQGVPIKHEQSWVYSDQDYESVCSQTFSEDSAHKMFKEHMNLVELRRRKSIENLQKLVADKGLSRDSYQERMKQIEERFVCQRESITAKKSMYLKILRSVKKEALQFQKELIVDYKNQLKERQQDSPINGSMSHGKLGIRQSFSAESIVLKSILKQPILKNREFKLEQYLIEKNQIAKEQNQNKLNQDVKQQTGIHHNQKFDSQLIKMAKCSFFDEQREEVVSILSGNYNSGEQQFSQSDSQLQQQEDQKAIFGIIKKAISQESLNEDSNDIQCRQQQVQAMGWSFESIKDEQMLIKALEKQEEGILGKSNNKVIETSISHNRLLPVETQLVDDSHYTSTSQNNLPTGQNPHSPLSENIAQSSKIPSEMMKRCSQQLQKLIYSQLINEFIQEIYLSDHLIIVFRPYIEQIYQFPPLTDNMIQQFAQQELKKHLPQREQLIRKANQKINPTSLQILRLVRDFNFQIDQYQLILSQDIFRKTRKHIQQEYALKITQRQNQPIKSYTTQNQELLQKVHDRQTLKRAKITKYMEYERDMNIMYMKAVFNCLNEFLIQEKSIATHVNTRTNIGSGELGMSIKEFNSQFSQEKVQELFRRSYQRMSQLIRHKCMLPTFKNYKQVSEFQQQMIRMIRRQYQETEYKWVTYMDEVLEIWDDVANWVVKELIRQAVEQIGELALSFKSCQ